MFLFLNKDTTFRVARHLLFTAKTTFHRLKSMPTKTQVMTRPVFSCALTVAIMASSIIEFRGGRIGVPPVVDDELFALIGLKRYLFVIELVTYVAYNSSR